MKEVHKLERFCLLKAPQATYSLWLPEERWAAILSANLPSTSCCSPPGGKSPCPHQRQKFFPLCPETQGSPSTSLHLETKQQERKHVFFYPPCNFSDNLHYKIISIMVWRRHSTPHHHHLIRPLSQTLVLTTPPTLPWSGWPMGPTDKSSHRSLLHLTQPLGSRQHSWSFSPWNTFSGTDFRFSSCRENISFYGKDPHLILTYWPTVYGRWCNT